MIEPIVIKVTDKVPELVSGPDYAVCDNSDYTVVWQLDEEWAQFEHRTMQVNYKDGTYERVLFTGDTCALPALPVPGPVHVGLFAGDIHTTRPARLLAVRSATTDSGEERDPMPNGYAQAIQALDGKLDKNQGAENVGKALVVDEGGGVVPGEVKGSGSYTLPVASPTQLGGVKPVAKTDTMTRGVGVDTDGGLYTEPGAWYVTVTQAFSDSVMATADKTAAEVYAAYQAGYAVYARVRLANVRVGFYVLPLVACIPNWNGGVATLGFSVAGQQSSVETHKVIWVLFRNNQWVIVSTDLAGLKDIPTALPNPNALAIKVGDTTTTYDGSAAKTVEVPDGNNPLGITSATVGQIPKITAVDASGVPTAWSPVDMAGGDKWEKLIDTSLAESVESVTYTFDDCKRIKALIAPTFASDESYSGWTRISINNVSYPLFNHQINTTKGIYIGIDSVYPPYVQANIGTNSNTPTYGFIGGVQTTALENIAPNGITEFGCQTAKILKAGTKIEIWGVKS